MPCLSDMFMSLDTVARGLLRGNTGQLAISHPAGKGTGAREPGAAPRMRPAARASAGVTLASLSRRAS